MDFLCVLFVFILDSCIFLLPCIKTEILYPCTFSVDVVPVHVQSTAVVHHRKILNQTEIRLYKKNDLVPNGRLFGSKSIRKW